MTDETDVPTATDVSTVTYDTGIWLLEEYKLLTQQYIHEDSQLLKTFGLYATLNSALLAFIGSDFANTDETVAILVRIVGLASAVAWYASHARTVEWRNYLEARIKDIEVSLHRFWVNEEILPLDLRTRIRWRGRAPAEHWYNAPYRWARERPSSLTDLSVPIIFFVSWLALLIRDITRSAF